MVLTFLQPSYDALTRILEQFSATFERPGQIAAEVLAGAAAAATLREASLPTLRMFAASSVFDDEEVLHSFVDHGLAPPASLLDGRRSA